VTESFKQQNITEILFVLTSTLRNTNYSIYSSERLDDTDGVIYNNVHNDDRDTTYHFI